MSDRPAAELLAEWMTGRWRSASPSEYGARELLERLARAEQALAENADAWVEGWYAGQDDLYQWTENSKRVETPNPYRAALRATQETERG